MKEATDARANLNLNLERFKHPRGLKRPSLLLFKGVSPMSPTLAVKPGEKVSESGIYEATRSGQRISLSKGYCAPLTPKLGEEWARVVDANRMRKSPAPSIARTARRELAEHK